MILRRAVGLLFAVLLPSITVLAQGPTTGRIAGQVKDPNDAVIAGAAVSVVSRDTGEGREAKTNEDGYYSVSFLRPGNYEVRVSAPGFSTNTKSTAVLLTETSTLDFSLKLPVLGDNFVEISPPATSADGPQLGRVVDSRAVAELPLATRNFTQILGLSPGTAVDLPDNTALGRNAQNISVNGARTTQNSYQINGVDANNIRNNNFQRISVPAPETIQEFKVQTSLYDATFGRSGGNIQAITMSGGNEFHGAGYEYFRDAALNANNPFLKAAGVKRPVLNRNVFGGLIGGPIKQDKIFFFGSYQGTRERNGASINSLSSGVLIAAGLTDDRSEVTLLATFRPRLPNGLPATSINSVALALLNVKLPTGQFLIPTPQADGHYSGSAISTYREDQFNTNVDYRINEKDWLAAKFFSSNAPQFFALPGGLTNVPGIGAD